MTSKASEVTWVTSETASKEIALAARDAHAVVKPRGKWTTTDERLVGDGERMEPLMAIGLIVATGWLVERLVRLLSDHLRPESQIVDIRNTPPLVLSAPHIQPPGTLLVIKLVNGAPAEERYTPDRRDEALAILPKLFP